MPKKQKMTISAI
jgi:hypothetical protein